MEGNKCQSCGIPLLIGLFGTNQDGTANDKYCKLCFEKGDFREPNLTIEEMTGRAKARMIDEQNMKEEEAEEMARSTIPTLERWSK